MHLLKLDFGSLDQIYKITYNIEILKTALYHFNKKHCVGYSSFQMKKLSHEIYINMYIFDKKKQPLTFETYYILF